MAVTGIDERKCRRCDQVKRQKHVHTQRGRLRAAGMSTDHLPVFSEIPLPNNSKCYGCQRRLASGRARDKKYKARLKLKE